MSADSWSETCVYLCEYLTEWRVYAKPMCASCKCVDNDFPGLYEYFERDYTLFYPVWSSG